MAYLHDIAKRVELGLGLFELLLVLLVFGQLEAFLGDGDQRLAVELAKLLHTVLVDGLAHVQHLRTFGHQV